MRNLIITSVMFKYTQFRDLHRLFSDRFHINAINFCLNAMKLLLYLIIVIHSIQMINGQFLLDNKSIFGYKIFDYDTDIKRNTVMSF